MKNSNVDSIQAYTHPNQQEIQQQSDDQTEKFEKGYKVFQLSSEVNEANLQIQKLCIKMERDKRQNRKIIQSLTRDKRETEQKYEQIKIQFDKVSTMLEAERQARRIGNVINKKKKEQLDIISQKINAKSSSAEAVIEAIQTLKSNQRKNQQNVETLRLKIEQIAKTKNQQIRRVKQQKQQQVKQLKQQLSEKMDQLISKQKQEKHLKNNFDESIKKLNQAKVNIQKLTESLKQAESQLQKQSKEVQYLRKDNLSKLQQIKKWRLKQQLSAVIRQKSQQQKIKSQQNMQSMRYQLCLSQKKIQFFNKRYQEQKDKSSHLELLLQQQRQQLRERQQKHIQLQQECQQLKKQLHICQIYHQKYSKCHTKLNQIEERANSFANIANQYAEQIQKLQQMLSDSEYNQSMLSEEVRKLKKEASQKQINLNAANRALQNQTEQLNQKDKTIGKLQLECSQLKKRTNALQFQLEQKNKQGTKFVGSETLANQIQSQLEKHFSKLLEQQSESKKLLQQQLFQSKIKIVQIKNELSIKQKELAQQKQEKQLLLLENNRLCKYQSQNQRYQQKRIVLIRDKYKQIERVKSQSHLHFFKKMRIECCFSYSFHSQFGNKILNTRQFDSGFKKELLN